MRRTVSSALFALATALLVAGCTSAPQSETVLISEGVRHPVTDKMEGVTSEMARVKAPDFTLADANGKQWQSSEMLKTGPIVVISIKDECPCSFDSQPLFNSLAKRYQGKATFVGLFNESPDKAKKYAKDTSTPYPILLDPKLDVYRAFKAERSVYVTLIRKDGSIGKMWPGYWADMLLELDGMLAQTTQTKLEPFDPGYAPKAKSSGCQLYQGEGYTQGDKP